MLLGTSSANAQSGLAALQAELDGKTFFLRSLCAGDNLRFDANGKPSNTCTREPFTLGLLTIDKVELSTSELHLTAHRGGLIFQNNVPQRVDLSHPAQGGKPHSVSLRVAAPLSGDFTPLLAAVFTTNFDDLLPNIPEAWQGFVKAHLLTAHNAAPAASVQPSPKDNRPVTQEEIDQAQINPLAGQDAAEPPVAVHAADNNASDPSADGVTTLPGRDGVSIPEVVRQRNAAFSRQAKSMRYGTHCVIRLVVNQDGNVTRVWVHRPAGLGLDEQALASVAQWKFEPATKNGKPIAVMVAVDLNFQIF